MANFRLMALVLIGGMLSGNVRAAAAEVAPGVVATKPSTGPSVPTKLGYMVPYKAKIPASEIEFEMLPIPGGTFKLGSPADENGRAKDEGPQVEIEVPPFWMGKFEITLAEYMHFVGMEAAFKRIREKKLLPITDTNKLDVVTAPSAVYDVGMTFRFGVHPRQPAISMSQYAAKQYTKWLSGLTGGFYRLPTEAEWEYACRAGTGTAFSFGNDPGSLADYAWFVKNSKEQAHFVGQKKPNAFGLHDMHGNVSEWTIDQYVAESYQKLGTKPLQSTDAIRWPTKLFPRVIRGGSWDDTADRCRSASRIQSDDNEWRSHDPFLPQSPYWFTNGYSACVGFRIIRPLDVPPREVREKFWRADLAQIQRDVDVRIDDEGRGSRSVANEELRQVLEKLK